MDQVKTHMPNVDPRRNEDLTTHNNDPSNNESDTSPLFSAPSSSNSENPLNSVPSNDTSNTVTPPKSYRQPRKDATLAFPDTSTSNISDNAETPSSPCTTEAVANNTSTHHGTQTESTKQNNQSSQDCCPDNTSKHK